MDTTLIDLKRDKQSELEDAEAKLGNTSTRLTRLLMGIDEFNLDDFNRLCEDVRAQFPIVHQLRGDLKTITARIREL